ncbi:MAG: FG-GAP-like repeat-containing protein [Bacteroidota bacterium]
MDKLVYTFTIAFLLTFSAIGQPNVLSVYPAQHRVDALADATIRITFDEAMNPGTIDHSVLRVFGRWSGPANGTIIFENGNTELTFVPDQPFFAGEQVMVSLSKDAENGSGTSIDNGYAWSYWIATASGLLDQTLYDIIDLREEGEGLLQAYGAYAGDLNNDGYSDFTVINETSDDLRILLNDGNGDYNNMSVIPMGDGLPSPNEGADFNNDGNIDLAVCAFGVDTVRIFLGDGLGGFQMPPIKVKTGDAPRGIAILDIDADGDDDIAVTNRFSHDMTIITNDNGSFTTSTFDPLGTGETAIAMADANNDGISDLFIGMYNSQELAILLCDGNGGLSMSDKVSVIGRPWMIATGDLNNDGNADVVSANSNAHTVVVSLGDGNGNLSTPISYPSNDAFFPLAIDLGDIDGDGDLDMVSSNYSSTTFIVFENDGNGAFSVASTLSAPEHASCAILHDRDNDGDLDISGTDEGADVIMLFENELTVSTETPFVGLSDISVFPNPFSDKVNIEYELNQSMDITVSIQDLTGKLISTLHDGIHSQGKHNLLWSGSNNSGIIVANGVYLVTIEAEGRMQSREVTFIRQ